MLEKDRIRLYVSSLRLERWPRSLAIFPGVVMAYLLTGQRGVALTLFARTLLAFLITWGISTTNYIVNEITDAPYDAHHPAKRHRPLVKREIRRRFLIGFGLGLVLVCCAVGALLFSLKFLSSLLLLLLAGILYNVKPVRLKDVPYVDSTLESANNPIRFLIGWFVLAEPLPPLSLLVSWWAFGNFLMVGKRVAEKKFLTDEQSAAYRRSLKKYTIPGLIAFMAGNALLFLATFVLFAVTFHLRLLLYTLPFLLFYLVIFTQKSIQDRETAEEPEKLLKNPYFALYTLFLVALIIMAFVLR